LPLADHLQSERLANQECAQKIDLEMLADVGSGRLFQTFTLPDSCTVHDDIDAPELFERGLDQFLHLSLDRKVGCGSPDWHAVMLGQFLGILRGFLGSGAIMQYQGVTFLSESHGDVIADPSAPASRDHGYRTVIASCCWSTHDDGSAGAAVKDTG
jgi:hypothetical protein